ncbi:23S rRNA (adenine(1618)-N(6))-methyltransferase RlmF [Myxococcota bacterium]|nr:23S rRNA (adenine(1618)-N(6))-methyltransferase RlmF [Myxococcota bacterium]MBU1535857.1 23S rRNA (adenine(1618)-N(6))-methyltransferase RlmF [Myxococcota bacterium]
MSRPKKKPSSRSSKSDGLHPRNPHGTGYDFARLTACYPPLGEFVRSTPRGTDSVDFSDPGAVRALNSALLFAHHRISHWELPEGYLCPPVPGRDDYLHYLADCMAEGGSIPRGRKIRVLDIGTGASIIYPLLGVREYGWSFVGTDIDRVSLENGSRIIEHNELQRLVELRLQADPREIFTGVFHPGDIFDAVVCNPPFFASAQEADRETARKLRNLHGSEGLPDSESAPVRNFGGRGAELWCEGGERQFLQEMINQSADLSLKCLWFTSLVSKKETLSTCYNRLRSLGVHEVKTIQMSQGQKVSRVLAWSFFTPDQRLLWRKLRW